MTLNAIDSQMVLACFDAFGVAATYTPIATGTPIDIRVIVDKDVDQFGFDSTVTDSRTEIELLVSDVSAPRRGDTIDSYTVASEISNDGLVVRVAVKETPVVVLVGEALFGVDVESPQFGASLETPTFGA